MDRFPLSRPPLSVPAHAAAGAAGDLLELDVLGSSTGSLSSAIRFGLLAALPEDEGKKKKRAMGGRGARPSHRVLQPGDHCAGRVRDGEVGAGADSIGASAKGEVGSGRRGGLGGRRGSSRAERPRTALDWEEGPREALAWRRPWHQAGEVEL
ncbi:hypothetical protein BAE44_0007369 [Dichanthelium oligosanthes]|uniref:Uncharacterized protein n=1 Tax=Dichanthelium oligosanthes TaxID=888268 RepID=A0A1E5W2M6_9POAL|nr:hypothetical protein BAE44_0007369 [Dichanthelium oligosanthes]